ncbi:MAG: hypothetical protein AB7E75_03500 [Candidatus Methanomethylophilaceae archaeon]|jgi:hypothetical protein
MIGYVLSRVAMGLAAALLVTAVLWETNHLIDWCRTLYEAYGDGSVAGYLRMHAYTYVTFVFGEGAFGWTVA